MIGTRLPRSLSISMPLPSESYQLPQNWFDIKAVTAHAKPTSMYTVLIQHRKKIACKERKQITRTGHKQETTIKHTLSKQRTVFPRTRKTTELIPRHYCFAPANGKVTVAYQLNNVKRCVRVGNIFYFKHSFSPWNSPFLNTCMWKVLLNTLLLFINVWMCDILTYRQFTHAWHLPNTCCCYSSSLSGCAYFVDTFTFIAALSAVTDSGTFWHANIEDNLVFFRDVHIKIVYFSGVASQFCLPNSSRQCFLCG